MFFFRFALTSRTSSGNPGKKLVHHLWLWTWFLFTCSFQEVEPQPTDWIPRLRTSDEFVFVKSVSSFCTSLFGTLRCCIVMSLRKNSIRDWWLTSLFRSSLCLCWFLHLWPVTETNHVFCSTHVSLNWCCWSMSTADGCQRNPSAQNEISSMNSTWLSQAKSLKNLDLSHNKIAEFPAGIFSNGSRVQLLWVTINQASSWNENTNHEIQCKWKKVECVVICVRVFHVAVVCFQELGQQPIVEPGKGQSVQLDSAGRLTTQSQSHRFFTQRALQAIVCSEILVSAFIKKTVVRIVPIGPYACTFFVLWLTQSKKIARCHVWPSFHIFLGT